MIGDNLQGVLGVTRKTSKRRQNFERSNEDKLKALVHSDDQGRGIVMEAVAVNQKQILSLAENLREQNGYIDVVKLANEIGIEVYATSGESNFNAEISFENDQFSILVNEDHPELRRRFSVAHEIGHYVLHRHLLQQEHSLASFSGDKAPTERIAIERERHADALAAEILMPKAGVDKYLRERNTSPDSWVDSELLSDIAECFKVSRIIATTTMLKLGYAIQYVEVAEDH